MQPEDKQSGDSSDKKTLQEYEIEELIDKRVLETLRTYKVVISLTAVALTGLCGFLGIQIQSIYPLKQDVEIIKSQAESSLDSVREIRASVLSKALNIQSSLEELQVKTDDLVESSTDRITFIDQRIKQAQQLDAEYKNIYKANYDTMNSTVSSFRKELECQQKENTKWLESLKETMENVEVVTSRASKVLADWEDQKLELIALSSNVSVYVERCSRREPEEDKPLHDYKPSYVRLPFSDKSLTIVFNKYKVRKGTDMDTGLPIKYKEIELYITVKNSKGEEIYKNPMILQERQYRERIKKDQPQGIHHTNHTIDADFVYLPPNPLMRIPDFAILTISVDPSSVLAGSRQKIQSSGQGADSTMATPKG